MQSKRAFRASWNFIEPPMACLVSAATSSPFPMKAASSSMDSSVQNVESTSKHTSCTSLLVSVLYSHAHTALEVHETSTQAADDPVSGGVREYSPSAGPGLTPEDSCLLDMVRAWNAQTGRT